jgi:hypothetical protein
VYGKSVPVPRKVFPVNRFFPCTKHSTISRCSETFPVNRFSQLSYSYCTHKQQQNLQLNFNFNSRSWPVVLFIVLECDNGNLSCIFEKKYVEYFYDFSTARAHHKSKQKLSRKWCKERKKAHFSTLNHNNANFIHC